MSGDESVRGEASTRLRQADVQGERQAVTPDDPPSHGSADQNSDLAEAQTVIRGSSRAPVRGNSLDRTPAAVAQVLLGQRLNHFVLEELIGGGGMGAVFRARDERLDRVVAIKVIPFVGEDPDLKRRFRNEAQSAAKLDHPHIARVFEVGSQADWHYIVFEYVSGINVRDKVTRDGALTIDDAVFVTCQLAEAIQHSADRGIVHRDIKPSNVLIGDDDQIKLVDMGLARSENFEISEDMTASGVTLGTFDYISPEQARDPRDADIRSDIYSLGCTLYFMLTGNPPFPGGTMLQKLLSHGNSPPPDPRLLRPEVSDELTAVIRKMLAKSPDDRYQNALDLILDLRQIAEREGLSRSRSVAAVIASEPNRLLLWLERHAPWLAAASLLILSGGWLQLHSAVTRDSFNLSAPPVTASSISARGPAEDVADPRIDRDEGSDGEPSAKSPDPARAAPESAGTEDVGAVAPGTGAMTPGTMTPGTAPGPGLPNGGPAVSRSDPGSGAFESASEFPEVGRRGDTSFEPTDPQGSALLPIEVPGPGLSIRPPLAPGSPQEGKFRPPLLDEDIEVATADREVAVRMVRVVGPDTAPRGESTSGVAITRTLREAIRVARREGVDQIEIATPAVESAPLELADSELSIVSVVPGGSTLAFRPQASNLSMQRAAMFRVGASRVTFKNLHFVWKVPVAEVDGGAMFRMEPSGIVRLNDCSVTIDNAARRDGIFAFDVITDPESPDRGRREADAFSPDQGLPLVAIELDRVVVRGEISMIYMDFAAELQLRWRNGLLAVSRRLLDTSGALERPAEAAGPIQLSLEKVTARTPLGLARMRLGMSGAHPIAIDRDAVKCVFVVDEGVPHFAFEGLEADDSERQLLHARGESNAYDASPSLIDPFLVTVTRDGDSRTVRLIDLLTDSGRQPGWWDERSPRWTVRWTKIELPNVSPSQLMPSDFRQDGILIGGFEEEDLPMPRPVSEQNPPGDP